LPVVGCGGGVAVGAASGGVGGLVVRAPTPRAASVVGLAPWEALPWRLCRGSRHARPCCRLPSPSWAGDASEAWATPAVGVAGTAAGRWVPARPGRRSGRRGGRVGTSRGCGSSHDGGERHRVGDGVVGGAVGDAVGDGVGGLAARGRVAGRRRRRGVGVGAPLVSAGVASVAPPCSHVGGLAEVEAA